MFIQPHTLTVSNSLVIHTFRGKYRMTWGICCWLLNADNIMMMIFLLSTSSSCHDKILRKKIKDTCKTNQKYLRNKAPNEKRKCENMGWSMFRCVPKEWNCKKKKKKAQAESKKPHQKCAVTVTKAYQIEKKRTFYRKICWCQNSCEIEVNISPSQKAVKINDVENVGTHNPFHT